MYSIKVHDRINQIISLYYFVGLWHADNRPTLRKWCLRIIYQGLYGYWPIALIIGSFYSDNELESAFLMVMAISGLVIYLRLCYCLWKKDRILEFIHKMGVHSIKNCHDYKEINNYIEVLLKFGTYYHVFVLAGLCGMVVLALPIFTNERKLPLNAYVPFNWKDSLFLYWVAFLYVCIIFMLSIVSTVFNVILWYLMMSCVHKYKLLGTEFKNISQEVDKRLKMENLSVNERQSIFIVELLVLTKNHQVLKGTIDQIKSFFSKLFFIQLGTSGLAICISVYLLVFTTSSNPIQYGVYIIVVVYQFVDILIITYFGNEIKYWSGRLSYCLFESNWMDQSKLYKQCMVILMEVLKKPQVLVIGKLYPLDLEIFINILNFAYGSFNILKKLSI